MTAYDPAAVQTLSQLQASGLSVEQAHGMMNRMVDVQAYTLAANDVFNGAAVLFLLLIALVWMARPAKRSDAAPGGAAAAGAH